MLQEGTNAYALNSDGTGTINYNIGNDLSILASKDTYSYTSEENTKSAGGSVGNNGVQFNYDQSDASSKVRSTTYNNVDIIANNINIKTGNNTDIKGANVLAQAIVPNHSLLKGESNEQGLDRSSFGGGSNIGGNINMDIGNNLNIESLQDTYYAKSKSSSFGVSFGGGKTDKGSKKGNGGFNIGKTNSTTDSQWVNEQTSIIADNNINIRTNNNTNLIGSVVASNSDNLSLNTGSLTYSDLNDFYREETKGYNFGTSAGGNRTDQKETNLHPQGSTTIGLIHTGQEKEQITRATIGLGNITINSEPLTPTPLPQGARDILVGLNRDVNNSQEITKDIITGALNASMTIDNRVFTSDGRSSIANDFKNLPDNAIIATEGALSDTKLVLDTSADILGAIPLSPVWFSRKLTEKTDIPPHPFPSFGIGDEVMGRASLERDMENKPVPDKGYLNRYTQVEGANDFGADTNPVFRFLYATIPGAKAATDEHDIKMKNEDSHVKLALTIVPSFAATYYGIIGTILDTKNYGTNYNKIKESYNNGIRPNSVIRNPQGVVIRNTWKNKKQY